MNPIPPRCLSGNCRSVAPRVTCHVTRVTCHGREGAGCEPCPGTPGSDCTSCDDTPDPSFAPPCDEVSCYKMLHPNKIFLRTSPNIFPCQTGKPGLCSGNMPSRWGSVAVVDSVVVPSLAPGPYVLQWRLDCEATAQVWTNCADITLQ